jgi:phosphoglycerol transferase MdoB-like AlkP superfamily enzyme
MKFLRYIPYLLSCLFFWFAYLQWNDPDRWLWIAIYGATGFFVAMDAKFWRYRWWVRSAGLIALLAGIYLLPNDLENWIELEEAREGFGLVICACGIALGSLISWSGKRK